MVAILRVLYNAPGPLGAERIALNLHNAGMDISERGVRTYLAEADACEWTRNLGRRGRFLTDAGRYEVDHAFVIDKVGFIAAKVDQLAYQMTLNPETRKGSVILNTATVQPKDIRAALRAMRRVYEANLCMGRLLAVAPAGEHIGLFHVPNGRCGIGTICSVNINGLLLRAGVATTSRFGGLVELKDGRPQRFTEIINYDGSSLDPIEVFIRGFMTSVGKAAKTGSGIIGASFREVPVAALPEVRRVAALSERLGLGGILALGGPNQPLLDVPVQQGRAGLIVCAGLNVMAAVVEEGIATTSAAMSSMCEYGALVDYREVS
jgi:repressor of nif and glnA expression